MTVAAVLQCPPMCPYSDRNRPGKEERDAGKRREK